VEILESVEDGCKWCSLIKSVTLDESSGRVLEVSVSTVLRGPDVTPKGCFGLYLSINSLMKIARNERRSWSLRLHVFTNADDLASSIIPARPIKTDVASSEAYKQIVQWLKACKDHDRCDDQTDRPLPQRLIQMLPKPHLVDTAGHYGQYLTLSYCWGSTVPETFMLRNNNLLAYYKELRAEIMSPTIRDTIEVTTKMGLNYLWIDALCIIQDFEEDKSRNISVMHKIYQNALLTIVAARASNAGQGFLRCNSFNEGFPHRSDTRFRIPLQCYEGWGTVFLENSYASTYYEQDEPINSRAWTLQEQILSPRLLVYGSHTLQWRCRNKTCNLGDYVHNPHFTAMKLVPADFASMLDDQEQLPVRRFADDPEHDASKRSYEIHNNTGNSYDPWLGAYTSSNCVHEWTQLVRFYSNRKSSCPGDKLTALSGIAEMWPRPQSCIYLAGLWSAAIPQQLMWYGGNLTRTSEYRAPTWSWASVDGDIHFHVDGDDPVSTDQFQITVRGGNVTLKFPDVPYGEVTYGVLKLKARLLPCWYDIRTRDSVHGTLLLSGKAADAAVHRSKTLDSSSKALDGCARASLDSRDHESNVGIENGMQGHLDTEEDEFGRWMYCMPVLEDCCMEGLILEAM
jgi:Heterokaryon incompatibility protein (HET)